MDEGDVARQGWRAPSVQGRIHSVPGPGGRDTRPIALTHTASSLCGAGSRQHLIDHYGHCPGADHWPDDAGSDIMLRADADSSSMNDPLATTFCGLDFSSPVVLLSGCVGFGEEYTRVEGFSNADAGAVVLKGTYLEARPGNPPHRVWETPSGMLNAIGLQNPGAATVIRDILPRLDFDETRFFANVCGSTIEEYAAVTERFDDSPIDGMEINISCPNVDHGGVEFGNDPGVSAKVVAACRAATSKPIIAKLSPNQTDIAANARACIDAGADALSVINTVMGMAIDVTTRRPILGNNRGGLSGPAIRPIALLKVHQVYQEAGPRGIPIIGQGGICNAQDAIEFLLAGASAIGLGTALFYDPLVVKKVNAGVRDYLQERGIERVGDLIGTVELR